MPLRPKQNLDNLTYILSKDATSGAKAGFDVQRMRNRLTSIEYDINHIQGDVDNILGDVVTNIYTEINDLRSWVTEEFGDFKEWTQEELENLKGWVQSEFEKVNEELTYIKTNYEHFETGTRLLFYQAAAPSGWSIVPGLEDAVVRVVSVNGGSLGGGATFPTVFAAQDVGNTTLTLNQIPAHGHSGSASSSGSHSHSGSASSAGAHAHSLEDTASAGGNPNGYAFALAFIGGFDVADWGATGGWIVPSAYGSVYRYPTDKRPASGIRIDTPKQTGGPGTGQAPGVEGMSMYAFGGMGDVSAIKATSAGSHSHSVSVGSAGAHTHTVSVGNSGGGGAHTHSIDLTVKHICVIVCQKEIVF